MENLWETIVLTLKNEGVQHLSPYACGAPRQIPNIKTWQQTFMAKRIYEHEMFHGWLLLINHN